MESSNKENEVVLCIKCNKTYANLSSLRSHNNQYHNKRGKKLYPCSKCEKSFSTRKHLLRHVNDKHTVLSFKCEVCERSYSKQCRLTIHKRIEHENKHKRVYECLKCNNKTFANSGGLREHNYYFHNEASKSKMYSCAKCDKSYSRRGSLSNHVTSMHSNKVFKCSQCNQIYNFKGNLKRHLQSIHQVQNSFAKPKCYFCEQDGRQMFLDNANLFNHMRGVHLKELPFTCRKNSYCIRRFANIAKARTHSLCPTKEGWYIANNKQKVCYFCSKAFYRYDDLQRHVNNEHTRETQYRCGLCQHPFNKYDSLKYHILSIHLKERYLKCDFCEYRTNSNTLLNIHKAQKHTKMYTKHCYFCKLGFATIKTLTCHMSEHTMEQLPSLIYTCYFCNKTIRCKQNFYIHLRSQHLNESDYRDHKKIPVGKIH